MLHSPWTVVYGCIILLIILYIQSPKFILVFIILIDLILVLSLDHSQPVSDPQQQKVTLSVLLFWLIQRCQRH